MLSKEEYLGAIAAGHMRYLSWELGEIAVRLHGDVAVLRYQAQLEINFGSQAMPRSLYWHIDS